MNPLITIIIPAYNHEMFIQEAINSAIDQTYENIELIIINDGSTDNTHAKIIELNDKCNARFKNFTFKSRENKGLLPTLKEVEPLINGKYFSILYSDDIFTKDRVKKQVNALESNKECALCYGKMSGIDKDSKIIKDYKTKHAVSGHVFEKLLIRNFIPAPTVMIRTKIFKEIGGYDLNYDYDDYPTWLKIAHDHKVLFLDDVLVYYRTHDDNTSSDLIRTIRFNEKVLLSWKNEPSFKKAIKRFYLRSFSNLAKEKNGYKNEAREYMLKAVPFSFFDPRFLKAVFRYYV